MLFRFLPDRYRAPPHRETQRLLSDGLKKRKRVVEREEQRNINMKHTPQRSSLALIEEQSDCKGSEGCIREPDAKKHLERHRLIIKFLQRKGNMKHDHH